MKRPARHQAPVQPPRDFAAEGREAFRAGKPVNAYPYPSGYSAEQAWIAGWVAELLAAHGAQRQAPEHKETAACRPIAERDLNPADRQKLLMAEQHKGRPRQ